MTNRMCAGDRRAHILRAARVVLARDGIDRFSLEEVAREADVAATLPRHYFRSRDGLLSATVAAVIDDLATSLTAPDPALDAHDRIEAYVMRLVNEPWSHAIWKRAHDLHPDIHAHLREIARRIAGLVVGRSWAEMSPAEQLRASGWVGYATAAVTVWFEQDRDDPQVLIDALRDGADRLGTPA